MHIYYKMIHGLYNIKLSKAVVYDFFRPVYPALITSPGFSAFPLLDTLTLFHETSMNFTQLDVAPKSQTLIFLKSLIEKWWAGVIVRQERHWRQLLKDLN